MDREVASHVFEPQLSCAIRDGERDVDDAARRLPDQGHAPVRRVAIRALGGALEVNAQIAIGGLVQAHAVVAIAAGKGVLGRRAGAGRAGVTHDVDQPVVVRAVVVAVPLHPLGIFAPIHVVPRRIVGGKVSECVVEVDAATLEQRGQRVLRAIRTEVLHPGVADELPVGGHLGQVAREDERSILVIFLERPRVRVVEEVDRELGQQRVSVEEGVVVVVPGLQHLGLDPHGGGLPVPGALARVAVPSCNILDRMVEFVGGGAARPAGVAQGVGPDHDHGVPLGIAVEVAGGAVAVRGAVAGVADVHVEEVVLGRRGLGVAHLVDLDPPSVLERREELGNGVRVDPAIVPPLDDEIRAFEGVRELPEGVALVLVAVGRAWRASGQFGCRTACLKRGECAARGADRGQAERRRVGDGEDGQQHGGLTRGPMVAVPPGEGDVRDGFFVAKGLAR